MDSARLQPALLGGIFIGVMSALPIINAGNCCCCLWVLAGGAHVEDGTATVPPHGWAVLGDDRLLDPLLRTRGVALATRAAPRCPH